MNMNEVVGRLTLPMALAIRFVCGFYRMQHHLLKGNEAKLWREDYA